jgi:septal ring factor EnvC (AmiA/AmiB activator)
VTPGSKAQLVLALALGFALLPGLAASADESPDRAETERRLQQVLTDLDRLREQLDATRREHRAEQARLRELDLAVQQASLAYRALEETRQRHETDLDRLEQQRSAYLDNLDDRTAQLARQLRAAYRSGRQSRTRLVLNLDDPEALTRMLAYYDYINRAQAAKITGLRSAVATLDGMQQDIDRELERLVTVRHEQQDVLAQLNAQRERRAALLASIAGDIEQGQTSLRELERDRRDLEALLERLADVLADIPLDLDQRTGVATRKGRLPMPLDGPVRHAFGQSRGGGMNWQGWLIGAEPGSEARAIAYGRVAFADWLRGYGLLLIIDHGQGYMSLYGYNESLLREVGAWVEPGEAISVVGSNPGSAQGLYFELRRNGKAVDPAAWLSRSRKP